MPPTPTPLPAYAASTSPSRRAAVVPAAIEVRSLTKAFGPRLALDRLSFRVPRGGITGFVGPNGSGKTTTIRILLRLAKPTSGGANVLGQPVSAPTRFLPKVGALIEGPAFDPHLSAARNLRVHAHLGKHPMSRIVPLLKLVGLEGAGPKRYGAFSLGMKQRLGVAAALLGDPELLILDEPTNGLDPAGIRDMRALFDRLRRLGKTLLISSHLLAEMERVCDHIVLIHDGRLLYQGPVHALSRGRIGGLEERVLALTEAKE